MNLPCTVSGVVEHGSGDGRKLGFPTANVRLTSILTLSYGVYASWLTWKETRYKSVLHFGPRLVFQESHPLFEVHVLDHELDLYDQHVSVELIAFIRATRDFPSLEALMEQIQLDTKTARRLLNV